MYESRCTTVPSFKIYQDNHDDARIKIYGNKDLSLNTDLAGNLSVTSTEIPVSPLTKDEKQTLINKSNTTYVPTQTYDVLKFRNWGFVVVNTSTGINPIVKARLEISPDNVHWGIEMLETEIEKNQFYIFSPFNFLKYARISYAAKNASEPINLDIYLQGQS